MISLVLYQETHLKIIGDNLNMQKIIPYLKDILEIMSLPSNPICLFKLFLTKQKNL